MNISSFDTVKMLVEEASKEHEDLWLLDEQLFKVLEKCCNAIDFILNDTRIIQIESEINEDTKSICLNIEYEGVISVSNFFERTKMMNVYMVLKNLESILIHQIGDDKALIRFVFPSLWSEK